MTVAEEIREKIIASQKTLLEPFTRELIDKLKDRFIKLDDCLEIQVITNSTKLSDNCVYKNECSNIVGQITHNNKTYITDFLRLNGFKADCYVFVGTRTEGVIKIKLQ